MVFLATFRLFGHLDNIFLILNFGVMVISAKWSILPGQYRGPYIRNWVSFSLTSFLNYHPCSACVFFLRKHVCSKQKLTECQQGMMWSPLTTHVPSRGKALRCLPSTHPWLIVVLLLPAPLRWPGKCMHAASPNMAPTLWTDTDTRAKLLHSTSMCYMTLHDLWVKTSDKTCSRPTSSS